MKILVAVKRVIDPYVKIRVKNDKTGVETQNIKMAINPFDEIAIEAAVRIKESQPDVEILVISIGTDICQDILRHSLALGADRAILIQSAERHCSLDIAKILQFLSNAEMPDLILLGKQSIDGDNNQTPQMLAALLNWPLATYVSKVELNNHIILATREIDGGLETLELSLPAIISTDLRLNEPRYASLPNIMQAKRKPLNIMPLIDLGIPLRLHEEIIQVTTPQARTKGIKLQNAQELIDILHGNQLM